MHLLRATTAQASPQLPEQEAVLSTPTPCVQVYSFCPHAFKPGEVRRIPVDQSWPVAGYWLSCPSCGHPNQVNCMDADWRAAEVDGKLVALSPAYPCEKCGRSLEVRDRAFLPPQK